MKHDRFYFRDIYTFSTELLINFISHTPHPGIAQFHLNERVKYTQIWRKSFVIENHWL